MCEAPTTDTELLDWLERQITLSLMRVGRCGAVQSTVMTGGKSSSAPTLREAIADAMKGAE
jgi:hypothetical protein